VNRRIPTPTQFLNRELGILAFQRRVLAQAADEAVPLLERLRFITIVSSNLDEFFEIRVAGLKEQIKLGLPEPGPDGRGPADVFHAVSREAHALVADQYRLLNQVVLPALAREGIVFPRREEWTAAQRQWIREYFFRELLPVLTPIGLDPAHPFPRVFNKSLNFAVELEGRDAFGRSSGAAIVQAPRALPRVIQLPRAIAGHDYAFIFLSSVLHAHVNELFAGMHVKGCYQFRVTRNSDLFVDEEEIKNLLTALQGELLHRHFGDAVRLEVADNTSERMVEFLLQQFALDAADLYRVEGPVNLYRLREVPDHVDKPALKYPPFQPGLPVALHGEDLFEVLKKQDLLLHHPFQSFMPVIEFIRTTANDPNVIAIKQTVYRTGTDSELMEILVEAARKGKEVTVVVELRRGGQPQLGDATRGSRRARDLRRGGPQDARQDGAGSAARGGFRGQAPAPLRPPRHRELPPAHCSPVHRLRTAHCQRGTVRRRQRGVQAAHRPGARGQAEARVAVALHAAQAHPRRDPQRGAARG
jgi:polyphosphate kinase